KAGVFYAESFLSPIEPAWSEVRSPEQRKVNSPDQFIEPEFRCHDFLERERRLTLSRYPIETSCLDCGKDSSIAVVQPGVFCDFPKLIFVIVVQAENAPSFFIL